MKCVRPAEKNNKSSVNALNINGCKIEDKNDICNAFNDYFATLGDKLVEKTAQLWKKYI